jgi:hypothetical protein
MGRTSKERIMTLDEQAARICNFVYTVCKRCGGYGYVWTDFARVRISCDWCRGIIDHTLLRDKTEKIPFNSHRSDNKERDVEVIRINGEEIEDWSPSTRWDHAGILIEWAKGKINEKSPMTYNSKVLSLSGYAYWWQMTPFVITQAFIKAFGGES